MEVKSGLLEIPQNEPIIVYNWNFQFCVELSLRGPGYSGTLFLCLLDIGQKSFSWGH